MWFIVIFVIILIIVAAVALKNFNDKENEAEKKGRAKTANAQPIANVNYDRQVEQLRLQELEKMHAELLPYVQQIPPPFLPGVSGEKAAQMQKAWKDFLVKPLPQGKSLYGCRTYGEVKNLNSAVVRRVDLLDDGT
ncbi:MAG: hypothetical protein ACI4LI_00375 [Candidatus Fimenecus sp.]